MTEPAPVVLEAVAQLARGLPRVDAYTAWARLAHLTPEQRAAVARAVAPLSVSPIKAEPQFTDGQPVTIQRHQAPTWGYGGRVCGVCRRGRNDV